METQLAKQAQLLMSPAGGGGGAAAPATMLPKEQHQSAPLGWNAALDAVKEYLHPMPRTGLTQTVFQDLGNTLRCACMLVLVPLALCVSLLAIGCSSLPLCFLLSATSVAFSIVFPLVAPVVLALALSAPGSALLVSDRSAITRYCGSALLGLGAPICYLLGPILLMVLWTVGVVGLAASFAAILGGLALSGGVAMGIGLAFTMPIGLSAGVAVLAVHVMVSATAVLPVVVCTTVVWYVATPVVYTLVWFGRLRWIYDSSWYVQLVQFIKHGQRPDVVQQLASLRFAKVLRKVPEHLVAFQRAIAGHPVGGFF